MLILWFASPFYHSLPENATRSRVPRLNAPNGHTPPAAYILLSHLCLRRPYFFQQRKKYGKERRQKPTVFGFPFRPIVTAVQKGSAPDRLHSYPRCRSCVPRENFLLSRRTGEVLYILHTFIFCGPKGRTYLSQSAGKRHPLPRPAFERPQWAHPAHTYLVMPPVAHPVGAGVPDGPFSVLRLRAAPASCMYASGGHISFNSERNMEKNAAKNRRFLDFPFAQL